MGSIFEQKSFIRSFIKRICIDYPTATIEYTVPINKGNGPDNGKRIMVKKKFSHWPRMRYQFAYALSSFSILSDRKIFISDW